jgi:thiamine-phosphate pyrophosphorylase
MREMDFVLCLIADAEAARGRKIPSIIGQAVRGGVNLVQLRAKNLETREFLALALEVSKVLEPKKTPFIINDRVDIAQACGASGVHLGQKDLPLPTARKILGKKKKIGITVNTLREAREAEAGGADYLGVGPVFSTLTKKKLRPLLGLPGLKAIREKAKIPILAVGGITASNARQVMECGVDGIAVVSAIMAARDIRRATKELIEAMGFYKR